MSSRPIDRAAWFLLAVMILPQVASGQCPGSGDCFAANPTPGCADATCCEAVCAIDPFCCNFFWDGLCALEAMDLCDEYSAPCCLPDTSCEVLQSDACAAVGGTFPGALSCADVVCPQPVNPIGCVDALPIGPLPATVTGTTIGAPPSDAEDCGTSVTSTGVWYSLIGTGNTITLTTCQGLPGGGSADYDTKISVFCGGCDGIFCVAGNDDGPGGSCPNFQSLVTFCSRPGAEYLVLVHGFSSAEGNFTMAAFDDGTPCDADVLCPSSARPAAAEKGSLLLFSKIDLRWDDAGGLLQDTFLSLTNDFPEDVRVQMYFINGDPPLPADGAERAHPGWNKVDNGVLLTGDQPTYWSALTGLPGPSGSGLAPFTALDPGFPPGRPAPGGGRMLRGYALVWAVANDSEEIRWNHLSGAGTIVNYAQGSAWEYGAVSYAVVEPVASGSKTGSPGVLRLNGAEYSASFDQLLMNFQAVGSSAFSGPRQVLLDTDITLHPVPADLRQETDGPVTTKANFNVWNMNEVKFSGQHRCITCWDQTLASAYDPPRNFNLEHLQTAAGKARIDGLGSQECNVDFDPTDGACGNHPLDVCAQDAALTGLTTRLLTFDGGTDSAAASAAMIGLGTDRTARIRYDLTTPPPEGQVPTDPEELLDWIQRQFGVSLDHLRY